MLKVAFLFALAAPTPQQINLVCSGQGSFRMETDTRTFEIKDQRLNIDLVARVWCVGDCATGPKPIVFVSDTEIILVRESRVGSVIDRRLNRVSGDQRHEITTDMPDTQSVYETRCRVAPGVDTAF